ncbi:MAG: sugar phosphate isomerase/epimerase, partial [Chloroflexota bacterium]|nr:sugar phosphate isomerase/epimerase [Chloroflexota bacterium]
MVRPGIFESIFRRSTLAETFQAVAEARFGSVQLDFSSADLDPWTGLVTRQVVEQVRVEAEAAGLRIPAVSGTFNMAHPDPHMRGESLAGLERIASQAGRLGASFVTQCTGTRDTSSMWRWHPDNATPEAWADMVGTVTSALEIAERHDVVLVVEPEPANVVSSAAKARELLDQLASLRLKTVLDPANIVLSDRSRAPEAVLAEGFALLGPDIVFAHAKDLSADGEFCAAGTGIVPWDLYW